MGVRGNARLLRSAVVGRWDVDKTTVLRALSELLDSNDDRARATALKIATEMESQNQKDDHKVIDVRVAIRHDQLAKIASDLGIDESVIEDANGQGGDGDCGTPGSGDESANDGA